MHLRILERLLKFSGLHSVPRSNVAERTSIDDVFVAGSLRADELNSGQEQVLGEHVNDLA